MLAAMIVAVILPDREVTNAIPGRDNVIARSELEANVVMSVQMASLVSLWMVVSVVHLVRGKVKSVTRSTDVAYVHPIAAVWVAANVCVVPGVGNRDSAVENVSVIVWVP